MLNSISISHVFVSDQDKALDFYVGKLGLEISSDQDLGFMRANARSLRYLRCRSVATAVRFSASHAR